MNVGQGKRVSVAVSDSFHRRLKTTVAARETTIADIVRQLLEEWIEKGKSPFQEEEVEVLRETE